MVKRATTEFRRWRLDAVEAIAAYVESAPDATLPAYPTWKNRHLAVHVTRICRNATIALRRPEPQRPVPRLTVGPDDEVAALAAELREAWSEAERALEACRHDLVWTPVGVRAPQFWERRLLREGVLHRWDAAAATHTPISPHADEALELIDEFLDTDMARAFSEGTRDHTPGLVRIDTGERNWTVDLGGAAVIPDGEARDGLSMIRGDPASVWLLLMRRGDLPGPVEVVDRDGAAGAFIELIDGFNRPSS